ncbi:Lrp/AsnC family transcriptional regulator [Kushneria phyllosphaerae]|uniref:Leucine-responsive regulatory protein n=1 Tax=Kushneria phyllosphaerae TaxID=2100822 RepID=A0A2R8CQ83_9GAMM|nr:Lrp/AsnC family transcriptional regulator [Kushneria phyllosphaerae]SPJ34963.1 Leucine-responsive regulatory protein [Kushneria phyllosphaerae]
MNTAHFMLSTSIKVLEISIVRERFSHMNFPSGLDKFDIALLELLQKNCLTPLRELAAAVSLSPATVQRRIQRLKESNYILANISIVNPDKVNKKITVLVEVQADRIYSDDLDALKKSFSGPEIQQCYYVTGEADFMLVFLVSDMKAFEKICDRLFHDNLNVKWFKTTVVLDRVKATLDAL